MKKADRIGEQLGRANSMASVSRANVTSSMCPASMLAKSRTARLNGRRTMLERNSMSPTRGRIATGTFTWPQHAGEVAEPVVLEADDVGVSHTRTARNNGGAMRAVAGICRIGMIRADCTGRRR